MTSAPSTGDAMTHSSPLPADRVWRMGPGRLVLRQGDITRAPADVVVNAANAHLAGGGGVDGAIHHAAGHDRLQAACREIIARRGGPLAAGQAEITPGFDLPAKWIVHAVGPIWRGGAHGEPAFPAISTGVYGYPVDLAAPLALETVAGHLASGARPGTAFFYLFSAPALDRWSALAETRLGTPRPAGS